MNTMTKKLISILWCSTRDSHASDNLQGPGLFHSSKAHDWLRRLQQSAPWHDGSNNACLQLLCSAPPPRAVACGGDFGCAPSAMTGGNPAMYDRDGRGQKFPLNSLIVSWAAHVSPYLLA